MISCDLHDAARLPVQKGGSNAKDLAPANSDRLHASCMQACSMMMAVQCNASTLLQRSLEHLATLCAFMSGGLVALREAINRVSSLNIRVSKNSRLAETVDI